jgi:ribonuclease VapC
VNVAVLDASAVLAFVQGEPGAARVEDILSRSRIPAPNWAEVLQKAYRVGGDARHAGAALKALGLEIEIVAEDDAEIAARLAADNPTLSLGDRFCLAVAERLEWPVYTADRAWVDAATSAEVALVR